MIRALFTAAPARWDSYREVLPAAFAERGLEVDLSQDHAPDTVDYLIYAPGGAVSDFRPFTRARAVLCLWAGVETIVGNPTLTLPLARMVDPGLTEGMVEYVVGHTLRITSGWTATSALRTAPGRRLPHPWHGNDRSRSWASGRWDRPAQTHSQGWGSPSLAGPANRCPCLASAPCTVPQA